MGNKDSISNKARSHSCDILAKTLAALCLYPENSSEVEFKANGLTCLEKEISRQKSVIRLCHGYCSPLTHRFTMSDSKNWSRKARKGRKVCAQFKVSNKESANDDALVIVKEIRRLWDSRKGAVRIRPYPTRLCLMKISLFKMREPQ